MFNDKAGDPNGVSRVCSVHHRLVEKSRYFRLTLRYGNSLRVRELKKKELSKL